MILINSIKSALKYGLMSTLAIPTKNFNTTNVCVYSSVLLRFFTTLFEQGTPSPPLKLPVYPGELYHQGTCHMASSAVNWLPVLHVYAF